MSATRWRNLGQALSILPHDSAIRSRWSALLGAEMPAVEPYLRKRGTAAVVELPDERGSPTTWRVVHHGKNDLVGVDDDSGDRITLAFADIQLWSLDWPTVIAALRRGLGLTGPSRPIADAVLTWEVGRMTLTDHQTAAILLCGAPRHHLGSALNLILAEGFTASVVLVSDPAMVLPETAARLMARKVHLIGIGDALASDGQGRLVGVAGPESIVGDLRTDLGLASVDRPPFQFIRMGSHWEITFQGQSLSVDDQKGLHYICLLLQKPNVAIDAKLLIATVANVDAHLVQGSKGVVTDRKSRDEYMAEYRRLAERIARLEPDNSDRDRLEEEQDRIMEALKDGDALGGEDRELSTSAKAGRAVGTAMNRAIEAIAALDGEHARSCASHLQESLKHRSGQKPIYKPSTPISWTAAR